MYRQSFDQRNNFSPAGSIAGVQRWLQEFFDTARAGREVPVDYTRTRDCKLCYLSYGAGADMPF